MFTTFQEDTFQEDGFQNPNDVYNYITEQRFSTLDNMQFIALDSEFNATELIDAHESIIWTEKYNDVGDFEIHGPLGNQLISVLSTASYIFNTKTLTLMVIEKPTLEYDQETGSLVTISGRSLSSILDRRVITTSQTVLNPTDSRISQIVCDLVSSAFSLSDSSSDRHWDKLSVVNATSGSSVELPADYGLQFTIGDNLLKIVSELCKSFNLGFKFEYSLSDQTIDFIVYEGTNRSIQGENMVVFSDLYDNLVTAKEELNFSSEKNTILVIGSEVDSNNEPIRPITLSPNDSIGLNRRETFFKSDLKFYDEETQTTLTQDQYAAILTQTAIDELNKPYNNTYRNYNGEIRETTNFKYGINFNLGDIVAFRMPHYQNTNARLIGMTFSDDANAGHTLAPEFEYIEGPTAILLFKDDFNRANSSTVGTGYVEAYGDWSISNNKLVSAVTGNLRTPISSIVNFRASITLESSSPSYFIIDRLTAGGTGYSFMYVVGYGCYLYGHSNSASTPLGETYTGDYETLTDHGAYFQHTHSAGDRYGFEICDNVVRGYLNGVKILEWTCRSTNIANRYGRPFDVLCNDPGSINIKTSGVFDLDDLAIYSMIS